MRLVEEALREICPGAAVRVRSFPRACRVAMAVAVAWVVTAGIGSAGVASARQEPTPHEALAREILAELIAIRTTAAEPGSTVEAAEAMAARLAAAGFPADDVVVTGPEPHLGNLVARYRGDGSGGAPILLMAHLDVVDALRDDWSFEPFELRELDGYLYGRGTSDNKAGAAILMASFLRLKEEGFVPTRDLIMVLTADEETSGASIDWLVRDRHDLVDAEFALNSDAGGGSLKDNEPWSFGVQASEKVYLSFTLEARNRGGHSSIPRPDNAIYRLAAGLGRLEAWKFPIQTNEVTSAYFARSAELETGSTAEDMRGAGALPASLEAAERLAASMPYYNALLRTTCVATQLQAGHAENALPQTARAVVNCRILPDQSADEVERSLNEVVDDDQITIARIAEPKPSPPSPLTPEVLGTIERLVDEMWPGIPVIPTMSTGATDGLFVRNSGIPVYGVSAIFEDPDDIRAHGRDERVPTESFNDALEFWYRMLSAFAG